MTQSLNIRRNDGRLEDVLKGYQGLSAPEERREQRIEGGLLFDGCEELLRKYERCLQYSHWTVFDFIRMFKPPSLSPEQINHFMQSTLRYEQHKSFTGTTGYFITSLIKRSYKEGNSLFSIDTKTFSKRIDYLPKYIHAYGSKLEIKVCGRLGNWCCSESSNVILTTEEVGQGFGYNASRCKFKTSNPETLGTMMKSVETDSGNEIYLIHQDGSEELSMAQVSIRRNDSKPEDVLRGYQGLSAPEERREQKIEGSLVFDGFEELLTIYERYLNMNEHCGIDDWKKGSKDMLGNITALTPEQINRFLQLTKAYQFYGKYPYGTGIFLTELIQKSMGTGHRGFILNTPAAEEDIAGIAFGLEGIYKKPTTIIIKGNAGYLCGGRAERVRIVAGKIGDLCGHMGHIMHVKAKDVGDGFGSFAVESIFEAESAGDDCATDAHRSIFKMGSVGDFFGWRSGYCTFKTSNSDTLEKMMKSVPDGSHNRIYLIHPDGRETLERSD